MTRTLELLILPNSSWHQLSTDVVPSQCMQWEPERRWEDTWTAYLPSKCVGFSGGVRSAQGSPRRTSLSGAAFCNTTAEQAEQILLLQYGHVKKIKH